VPRSTELVRSSRHAEARHQPPLGRRGETPVPKINYRGIVAVNADSLSSDGLFPLRGIASLILSLAKNWIRLLASFPRLFKEQNKQTKEKTNE
jgi:hypothetical protein